MGAQENRVSKYYNEELYSTLAILDFGLSDSQCCLLLREGLDLSRAEIDIPCVSWWAR